MKIVNLLESARKKKKRKRKKEKEKKITAKIVATNVVASRLPNGDRLQRRRSCQL